MCGRYTSTSPPAILAEQFVVDEVKLDDDLEPRWNVAPTLPVLVVAESRSAGKRRLGTMRWGLVPSWAKDISRALGGTEQTLAAVPVQETDGKNLELTAEQRATLKHLRRGSDARRAFLYGIASDREVLQRQAL